MPHAAMQKAELELTRKRAVDEIADIFTSHLDSLPTDQQEDRLKALVRSVKKIRAARSSKASESSSTHSNPAQSRNRS